MSDPIACLLQKMEAGLVDKESAMEFKRLTENYLNNMSKKDINVAGKNAAEAFEHRTNSLALHEMKYAEKSSALFKKIEAAPDAKQVQLVVDRFFLDNQQFALNAYNTQFNAQTAATLEKMGRAFFMNPSVDDTMAILRAIMNGEKPVNPQLKELAAAIKTDRSFAAAELKRLGATGHRLPAENSMTLDFDIGRLQASNEATFIGELTSAIDIDHLAANIPYLDAIEGGINGYFKLVYASLRDGVSVHGHKIRPLGTSPEEFIATFRNNLQVTSPESWMRMQSLYGAAGEKPNVLAHLLASGESAARQAANLDYFAASPSRLLDGLELQLSAKGLDAADITRIVERGRDAVRFFEGDYNNHVHVFRTFKVPFTNISFAPVLALETFSSYGALLLGGRATLSSFFGDPAVARSVMKDLGLKTAGRLETITKATNSDVIKAFGASKEMAARLGLTIDNVTDALNYTMRGNMASMGARTVNKNASLFLRWTGMTPATNMNRRANLINTALNLGELKETAFEALPDGLKRVFDRFEIDAGAWEALRTKAVRQENGLDHISPSNILYDDPELGAKIGRFFAYVQEAGTPTGSIRAEKWLAKMRSLGGAQAAFGKTILTFMGFNGSVWQNHIVRALAREEGAVAAYARLAVYTTLSGALVELANHAVRNEKPDLSSPYFWGQAYTTGGSASYYGMLLETAGRALGGNATQAMQDLVGSKALGFTLGTVAGVSDVLLTAGRKAIDGEDYNMGAKLFNLAYKFIPGQSHWAFSYFMQENMRNIIAEELDPKAFRKTQRRLAKTKEQKGITPLFE
jgi:hypothetical protein